MHQLMTDFGPVPVNGYVDRKDMPAWERCAKAKARKAWSIGEECTPLTVEEAQCMPEWQPTKEITSMGYVYGR